MSDKTFKIIDRIITTTLFGAMFLAMVCQFAALVLKGLGVI